MTLIEMLDVRVFVHRALIDITGDLFSAAMLSKMLWWTNFATLEGGWFYKTQAQWTEELGMTRRQQEGARKTLVRMGLVKEEKRAVGDRLQHQLHFQVQKDALEALLQDLTKHAPKRHDVRTKTPSGTHQNAITHAPKRHDISESTSENTKESTRDDVEVEAISVEAIVCAHPLAVKQGWKELRVPHAALAAAIEALDDGETRDALLAKVRGIAAQVARWPTEECKYLASVEKFFRERQFNRPLEEWARSDGRRGSVVEIRPAAATPVEAMPAWMVADDERRRKVEAERMEDEANDRGAA